MPRIGERREHQPVGFGFAVTDNRGMIRRVPAEFDMQGVVAGSVQGPELFRFKPFLPFPEST